ncbi:DUF3043 domain-containing protein [Pseudactinotalea suaedae]|uniref:DUF3043 domain-containing protein n=1 Tax=Pseudactinotalea suaedae TaxID=1524924 RepID=UPI001391F3D3|nr:DUF3043 domain-containing protein [Pseudactinotalea suaedae]
MFGRKKNDEEAPVAFKPMPVAEETPVVGKGRPTPKRREAEAANKRPLISGDPKADKAKARAAQAKQRALMDQAMQTGDDRYLPAQHKGPVRRFARDWIDSRWTLGEFFLPVALLVIVVMFGGSMVGLPPQIIVYAILGLYAIVLVALIEAITLSVVVHRRAVATFGKPSTRGIRLYTAMRSMQMRRMRLPKPQVKRGDRPS